MKARGAAIQGGLAVLGLVAAYVTWQRPPDAAQGDVVVVEASKGTVQKVRFEDGPRWLELTRTEEGGPAVWLTTGGDPAAPSPPAADADGGVADAGTAMASSPPPKPPRTVRGSERAERLYERFSPLHGVRALGVLPPEKLKELGLEGSSRKLEVSAGGAVHRFAVSKPGIGLGTPYLRSERDGAVFLVGSSLISDLEPSGVALIDRRLHAFKPTEFDGFVVEADGKEREFVQTGAEIPATTKVAPRSTPDKPDEFARNWHDKVWNRLIVSEVLGRGELPASGAPQVVARIEYTSRGKQKGFLELARGEGTQVYARSEHTAGWVLLHAGAAEVVDEAKKIAGGS